MISKRFVKKNILITGATSGIGQATAEEFANEGGTVIILGRNEDNAKLILDRMKEKQNNCFFFKCDVKDPNDVKFTKAKIEKEFSQIDVIVNNAGIMLSSNDIQHFDIEEWDEVFKVNVNSVLYVLKYFITDLIKTKGCIINNSSIAGMHSYVQGQSYAYSASKSALIQLTRQLALNYAKNGVRVNCVCPGIVETKILGQRDRLSLAKRVPLGYIATPIDIAKVILFLASDDAKYITGSVLPIDGGVSL